MIKVEFLQDWSYGAYSFKKNVIYDIERDTYEVAKLVVSLRVVEKQPKTSNRMLTSVDYRIKPIDTEDKKGGTRKESI